MTSLFNYNTLKVSLKKEPRSLVVELNRPQNQNAINSEMIFELESLFSWCANRIEIHSILLSSTSEIFSCGLDKEEAKNLPEEKFIKNMNKLQKLIYSMFFLPQTIIADLKDGASGLGAELALGADLRLARPGAKIAFNHLTKGFAPACGGIGFLGALVPKSFAKNWLLSGRPIATEALTTSGLILELYTSADTITDVLSSIASQSPVARIQTKRAFLETMMAELDHALKFESQLSTASLTTGDWKKAMNDEKNFMSAMEMAQVLKGETREAHVN